MSSLHRDYTYLSLLLYYSLLVVSSLSIQSRLLYNFLRFLHRRSSTSQFSLAHSFSIRVGLFPKDYHLPIPSDPYSSYVFFVRSSVYVNPFPSFPPLPSLQFPLQSSPSLFRSPYLILSHIPSPVQFSFLFFFFFLLLVVAFCASHVFFPFSSFIVVYSSSSFLPSDHPVLYVIHCPSLP